MSRRVVALVILTILTACGSGGGGDRADGGTGSTCKTHQGCNNGLVCTAGVCEPPGSQALGSGCSATRDCQNGLYCAPPPAPATDPTSRCAQAGTGLEQAPCSLDSDCTAGLRCDYSGFTGRCAPGGAGDVGDTCAVQTDCLPGLFCGGTGPTCQPYATAFPPWPGVSCTPDTGPFHAYFEVPRATRPLADFYRLPYPTDVRVDQSSKALDLSDFPIPGPSPLGVDVVALYRDALVADFEGFSGASAITVRFSQDVDFASLGAAMNFIDLTTGAPLAIHYGYTDQRTKYNCQYRLTVTADYGAMRPGHVFAFVVRTGVRAKANATTPPTQDTDLAAVLSPTQPTGDAPLTNAWTAFQLLRTYMAGCGGCMPANTVATATVFTVQDVYTRVDKLATAVVAAGAPSVTSAVLCGGTGSPSPCDAIDAAHACPATPSSAYYEVHGQLRVPIFQEGTEPYLTPGDGGRIHEVSGNPTKVRDEDVCFALIVPKTGTAPWPLLVYGHGTGGSMRDFIGSGVADKMAGLIGAPSAAISFDAVEHGNRRGGSTKSPDDLVFNVLNPRAARDNFLQGAADVLSFEKVAALSIPVAGITGNVTFNTGRVMYFGHSQGATTGEIASGYGNGAGALVFGGAGALLVQSLLHKTLPVNVAPGIAFLAQDPKAATDASHPFMVLLQTYFDRVDPYYHNQLIIQRPPSLRSAKNVLMIWGTNDHYTPAATMLPNAMTLGVPLIGSVLENSTELGNGTPGPVTRNLAGNTVTGGVKQYAPSGIDGHFVDGVAPANTDWSSYLRSWILNTTMATIP